MTNVSKVLVRVCDLRKSYGSILALDGISFEVSRGDILAFLGPNGAGKTTAMKLITGFLEPDGGTVVVDGHDVWTDPLAAQRRIGYLPEHAPAYGEMTVDGFLASSPDSRRADGARLGVGHRCRAWGHAHASDGRRASGSDVSWRHGHDAQLHQAGRHQ